METRVERVREKDRDQVTRQEKIQGMNNHEDNVNRPHEWMKWNTTLGQETASDHDHWWAPEIEDPTHILTVLTNSTKVTEWWWTSLMHTVKPCGWHNLIRCTQTIGVVLERDPTHDSSQFWQFQHYSHYKLVILSGIHTAWDIYSGWNPSTSHRWVVCSSETH